MSRFPNSKKSSFLDEKDNTSLTAGRDTITTRCKFNFSYFTKQPNAGQDFHEWTHDELIRLLNTMKEYSREPLSFWTSQQRGRGKTLTIYDKFPPKSDFEVPPHIPSDVAWGPRVRQPEPIFGLILAMDSRKNKHLG